MPWYVLRTYSGKEKKVREAILNEAERQNMRHLIRDVMVPSENIMEMREGQKARTQSGILSWLCVD